MRHPLVLAVCALLVLAGATAVADADPFFDARRDFYAGDWPRDVAIGDFNGDDHEDLAVPLYEDEEVAILLGKGDGTFGPVASYQTAAYVFDGEYPFSGATGRLNADEYDDVVVANWWDNNIGILLANGDGSFAEADTILIGGGPNCVILADFNEDAKLDAVTANWHQGNITIVLGDGAGDFTYPAVVQYNVGYEPYTVAAGDFNEDDDLDVAVANFGDDDVSILLGNGDGTFDPAVDYPAGDAPHDIAIADVNHDDHLDLIVPNRDSHNVSVLLGNGNGTFQTAVNHATGESPYSVVAGDFDGDDDPDFAACCRHTDDVYVYIGNGSGGFATGVAYPVGEEPYSMAVGDFDEDDNEDIAIAIREGQDVAILCGRGDGTFRATPRYPIGDSPGALVVGDLNGDDDLDAAVVMRGPEEVGILLGSGDGTFAFDAGYAAGADPVGLAGGLFDADQYLDLATINVNERDMTVLLGDGDGTFSPGPVFDCEYGLDVRAVDLDGRGGVDLVVPGSTARRVHVYTGNGDGTFAFAGSCTTGGHKWCSVAMPAVGDFDGDTVPDLAAPVGRYNFGKLSMLLGNGDGTFVFHDIYDGGGLGGGTAVAGYFDPGDDLDVAMVNYGTDNVSIFLGNGDGTFQPAVQESVGRQPTAAITDDFDGDGHADLAIVIDGGLALLLGNGDGTFRDPDHYAGQEGTYRLSPGDYNEDGRLDLIATNMYTDDLSVFLNISPDTPVEGSFYAVITESAAVRLRWVVSSLLGIRGFNVYRATSLEGPYERVNAEVLAPASTGTFDDDSVWPATTFWYELRAVQGDGSEEVVGPFPAIATTGGRLAVALHPPRPNPFTSTCSFSIDVPEHVGPVRVEVYSVNGRVVKTLIDEPMERGRHPLTWDGTNAHGARVASGIYLVRLEAGAETATERFVLIR